MGPSGQTPRTLLTRSPRNPPVEQIPVVCSFLFSQPASNPRRDLAVAPPPRAKGRDDPVRSQAARSAIRPGFGTPPTPGVASDWPAPASSPTSRQVRARARTTRPYTSPAQELPLPVSRETHQSPSLPRLAASAHSEWLTACRPRVSRNARDATKTQLVGAGDCTLETKSYIRLSLRD
jgi:hypothetical protein